jgi:hypothetical protein
MPQQRLLGCLAPLLLISQVALAEAPSIGYVKTVTGQATIVAAGRSIKAEPGTPVYQDNILKTGKNGSLGLTLKDNTILSLGPDTEMVVDEYLYAPAQDELKLGGRVAKGSLNYVSGVIAKLKPEGVVMRTPSGNIGVRGTHFAVSVVED